MNSIKILVVILFTQLAISASGQARYSYDKSGNRVRYSIIVEPLQKASPQSITPQNKKETLLRDSLQASISVYPNPTQGLLNVDFKDEAQRKLRVYDLSGKLVSETIATSKAVVDISDQKHAAYILEVETSGQRLQWKILKQ